MMSRNFNNKLTSSPFVTLRHKTLDLRSNMTSQSPIFLIYKNYTCTVNLMQKIVWN